MSANKNYRLLTTAIVGALHPNEPSLRGAVWSPEDRADQLEADALVGAGYAEITKDKATHETMSARNAGKKDAPVSGADSIDAIRQPDGTYLSGAGVPVYADGSPIQDGDADITEFLAHNANDVIAALADADEAGKATLPRMAELEAAGKNRKTVLEAIEAAGQPE